MAYLLVALAAVASCGGGGKKKPAKPVAKPKVDKPPPPPETEADREKKRHEQAVAIVPDGSSCLPTALKKPDAPQLQLGAIGELAVLCAVDQDRERLLGPVACWKINLGEGSLEYIGGKPIPGRGFPVKLDAGCARGYCLPKGSKEPNDKVGYIVWSPDGAKVAVLAGDQVYTFNASTKSHDKDFSIHGDKGVGNEPSGLDWIGETIFVEGHDAGPSSAVWVFKADGTPVGPILELGGKDPKPVSTYGGSFMLLDKDRVAVSEHGFTSVTIYETDSGKRTKLVRKISNGPCKKDELDYYWADQDDKVGKKCKDHMATMFGHLEGADMVAGKKNMLALLRGPRLGELAVLDPKTLTEKKAILMPWCTGAEEKKEEKAEAPKPKDDEKKVEKKATTRGPKPKGNGKEEDPDAGGE